MFLIDGVFCCVTAFFMDEKISITAQLQKPLVEELKLIAKAEGRSLASQIRLFLANAVTQQNTATQAKAA
ncbi:hypothetical protein IMCC26134_15170 [Verrucomicrobia bacterium IMCC26134]|nr:hypothetical protein IMCC26134_15170 [Verrucomicrobia bacterium IMCC26134]